MGMATRRLVFAAMLFVLSPLAACAQSPTPTPTLPYDPYAKPKLEAAKEEYAAARERWEVNKPDAYSFQIRYTCHWCGYHDQPLEVTVRNGVIHSVIHVDSGTWFDYADEWQRDAFKNVDVLFNGIKAALDRWSVDIPRMHIGFDPDLGYPVNIYYSDYRYGDSLAARVENFQVLAPDATPVPTPTPLPDRDEALAELAAAKSLWAANGSDHYTIEHAITMRNPYVDYRMAEIVDLVFLSTIRDGMLESAIWVSGLGARGGEPVELRPSTYFGDLMMVDDLFARIEFYLDEALRDTLQPWKRRVLIATLPEYDAQLGYPKVFGFEDADPSRGTLGSGWVFKGSLRNYKPLHPSATPTPTWTPTPRPTPTPLVPAPGAPEVVGPEDFIARTRLALDMLWNHAPAAYERAVAPLATIKQEEHWGTSTITKSISINREHALADGYTEIGQAIWLAGVIVRQSCRLRLHDELFAEGSTLTGIDVGVRCQREQQAALEAMGARHFAVYVGELIEQQLLQAE